MRSVSSATGKTTERPLRIIGVPARRPRSLRRTTVRPSRRLRGRRVRIQRQTKLEQPLDLPKCRIGRPEVPGLDLEHERFLLIESFAELLGTPPQEFPLVSYPMEPIGRELHLRHIREHVAFLRSPRAECPRAPRLSELGVVASGGGRRADGWRYRLSEFSAAGAELEHGALDPDRGQGIDVVATHFADHLCLPRWTLIIRFVGRSTSST